MALKDSILNLNKALKTTLQNVPALIDTLETGFADMADAAVEGGSTYSTDERVVGTWIDGKPLYEKTWTSLSIALDPGNWVYFTTPKDIDNLITFDAYTINSNTHLHCAIAEYKASDAHGIMFSGLSGFNRTVNAIVARYTKINAS